MIYKMVLCYIKLRLQYTDRAMYSVFFPFK